MRCAGWPRSCCPDGTRGASGVTSSRACGPLEARACARPQRSTTATRDRDFRLLLPSCWVRPRSGLVQLLHDSTHDIRVELRAGHTLKLHEGLFGGARRAVWAVGDDRVVGVASGDDAGGKRDALAG